jgi:diguanylate cyclase (GGDEF)-like protein
MEEQKDILLIESRAVTACTIQAMLDESSGLFRKEWTYSLEEALEMLAENTFDCILTNIQLSEGGGTEIIEQLLIRSPSTPVIAIVENGGWEIGKIMLQAGAQDFLIREEISAALLRKSIFYSIERQRLIQDVKTLTIKDELTNLLNRRGFNSLAVQQLNMSRRTQRPCTMLFIDLDNLKSINDTHGHPVGDLAICETADILRDVLRGSDIIARLGGDEFVVLAPDTANGNVENILVRMQEAIDRRNTEDKQFQLSASVGVVTYDGSGEPNIDHMIAECCNKMHQNKRAKQKRQARGQLVYG